METEEQSKISITINEAQVPFRLTTDIQIQRDLLNFRKIYSKVEEILELNPVIDGFQYEIEGLVSQLN